MCACGAGHAVAITEKEYNIRAGPGQDLGVENALLSHEPGQQQSGAGAHKKFREAGHHGQHGVSHPLHAGDGKHRAAHGVTVFPIPCTQERVTCR